MKNRISEGMVREVDFKSHSLVVEVQGQMPEESYVESEVFGEHLVSLLVHLFVHLVSLFLFVGLCFCVFQSEL